METLVEEGSKDDYFAKLSSAVAQVGKNRPILMFMSDELLSEFSLHFEPRSMSKKEL